MNNLSKENKIQFVRRVFERESKLYINTDKEYDMISQTWLHRYISKANIENILIQNLDEVYEIALKLDK